MVVERQTRPLEMTRKPVIRETDSDCITSDLMTSADSTAEVSDVTSGVFAQQISSNSQF